MLTIAFFALSSMSAMEAAAMSFALTIHKNQLVELEFASRILACGWMTVVPLLRCAIVLSEQNRFAYKWVALIRLQRTTQRVQSLVSTSNQIYLHLEVGWWLVLRFWGWLDLRWK